MKRNVLNKALAAVIICSLMLVIAPTIVGREAEIDVNIESSNYGFEINVEWITYKYNCHWWFYFIITSNSTLSRVEFYINDGMHELLTGPGPREYETSPLQWNSQTKENTFKFIGYDIEGNSDTETINGSDIKTYPCSRGDIEFPKENGPYTVFIAGWHLGSLPGPIMAGEGYLIVGPFVYMKYPNMLAINLHYSGIPWEYVVMFIDGQGQRQLIKSYNRIEMYGFKGYYPGMFLQFFKLFPMEGLGRLRAFGTCEEIDFISPVVP